MDEKRIGKAVTLGSVVMLAAALPSMALGRGPKCSRMGVTDQTTGKVLRCTRMAPTGLQQGTAPR